MCPLRALLTLTRRFLGPWALVATMGHFPVFLPIIKKAEIHAGCTSWVIWLNKQNKQISCDMQGGKDLLSVSASWMRPRSWGHSAMALMAHVRFKLKKRSEHSFTHLCLLLVMCFELIDLLTPTSRDLPLLAHTEAVPSPCI